MHVKLFVELGVKIGYRLHSYRSSSLRGNGSIVMHRAKLANRWLATLAVQTVRRSRAIEPRFCSCR
jgi:hypothetical protein